MSLAARLKLPFTFWKLQPLQPKSTICSNFRNQLCLPQSMNKEPVRKRSSNSTTLRDSVPWQSPWLWPLFFVPPCLIPHHFRWFSESLLNSARLGFCCLPREPSLIHLTTIYPLQETRSYYITKTMQLWDIQWSFQDHAGCGQNCAQQSSLCSDKNYKVVLKACVSTAITEWKLPKETAVEWLLLWSWSLQGSIVKQTDLF